MKAHPPVFPIWIAGRARASCTCHWMRPIGPTAADRQAAS